MFNQRQGNVLMALASTKPRISIVVNTNGRVDSLTRTLQSFRALDYPQIEVCVVTGPSQDGTHELVAEYLARGEIKSAHCELLNLSASRNIGIRIAAGDLIAFIDDDGVPEPEWLTDLAPTFENDMVGGAGGYTYDHTGYDFQIKHLICDRFGNAKKINEILDSTEYCYPLAAHYAGLLGTNSIFRRTALVEIGGFDEEYEYYLDETDVCCRLIDAGWLIKQIDHGFVHHKFLASHLRNEKRAISAPFPVLKNKVYFSLINNIGHHTITEIIKDACNYFDGWMSTIRTWVDEGNLDPEALESFSETSDRAWRVGLERGLTGVRKLPPDVFFRVTEPFVSFPTTKTDGPRHTFIFVSQSYPPGLLGGTGRYTHDIACAIAALGHNVHVLTAGSEFNRVDREEGVWVHRIVPKAGLGPMVINGLKVPAHVWAHSSAMLEEARRIGEVRSIDCIEVVGWDCEAAAFVLDGRLPCAVNVVTSLPQFLQSHPELSNDAVWMTEFGQPMLDLEQLILGQADHIVAASRGIAEELQRNYDIVIDPHRLSFCAHGLRDWLPLKRIAPPALADNSHRRAILFAGRFEHRKGADILLAALPDVLTAHPDVDVWLAGDDTLLTADGSTVRQIFEQSSEGRSIADRVIFLGLVPDEELRWLYANSTVFVAPSRFESFGLIYVEAMMFSKPVIGCAVGGVPDVVANEQTGLLVPPEDVNALATAIKRVLTDHLLAERLGTAGRRAYETRFAADIIARRRIGILEKNARQTVTSDRLELKNCRQVDIEQSTYVRSRATLIGEGGSIAFVSNATNIYISFWRHTWSGLVNILVDGCLNKEIDLYSPIERAWTIKVACKFGSRIDIQRSGQRSSDALGSEVLVISAAETLFSYFQPNKDELEGAED